MSKTKQKEYFEDENDTESSSDEDSNETIAFINDIMNDDNFSEETRDEFYEKFAERYLKDKKFQEENKDKYVLFLNFKYNGIYEKKNIVKIGIPGDDRRIYRIGGYIHKKMYNIKSNFVPLIRKKNNYEPYEVDFKIHANDDNISCKYIVDDGADVTTMFLQKQWNCKRGKFNYVDETKSKISNKLLKFINNQISFKEPIIVEGVNDTKNKNAEPNYLLINFNHLIEFSIEYISKFSEVEFIVPINKKDLGGPQILSREVLKNYTLLFSSFNGIYGLKVFPLTNFKKRSDFNEIINHCIFDNSNNNSDEEINEDDI